MNLFASQSSSMIPHEAEVALAATVIANPALGPEVLLQVDSSKFANRFASQLIALVESGRATTPAAVAAVYNTTSEEPLATDDIYSYAVPPSHIAELVAMVSEYHLRRKISAEGIKLLTSVSDASVTPITAWSKFIADTTVDAASDRAPRSLMDIVLKLETEEDNQRIFTGSNFYDNHYYLKGGSRRRQLEYVLAQPGHGKSTYLAWLAQLYAKAGNFVVWFQFENSAAATARSLLHYGKGDWMNNVLIADGCRTYQDMQMQARRIASQRKLDVVMVDYLQIVEFVGIRSNQIREKVVATSSGFRDFAKFNDCYVIVASQADRMKDRKGYDAFPRDTDGRESSQIESDAFIITSIFRPNKREELRVDEHFVKSFDGMRTVPKEIVYARNAKNRDDSASYMPFAFLHQDQLVPYNEAEARPYRNPESKPKTGNAIAARVVEDEPEW